MANTLYNSAREAFLNGGINWGADVIKCVLVDTLDYGFLATHDFLSEVPAAARVATSAALTGKTATDGVADAADITLTAVAGDQSEAVIIYKEAATEAASQLIAYIDTATGLPITPNGGDISIVWDNGASKIFKI